MKRETTIIEALGFFLVTVVIVLLFSSVITSMIIRQQIIEEKTGVKVSWWKAINYPESYFTDATVKIKKGASD